MQAQQSTKPSTFLPVIRSTVVTALGLTSPHVRIVAEPDPTDWAYQTGTVGGAIYLHPESDLPNAGAGRQGTPISQVLEVYIRTRSFRDQAGGNETAALKHYDYEGNVVNAIHLQHLNIANVPLFIMPPRLIPDGSALTRSTKPDGSLLSTIKFRLDYVLDVTV